MQIVRAVPKDHQALTRLTIESKSFWDYSAEQIEQWIPDLTILPSYIEEKEVFKLVDNREIIGYYSFEITAQEAHFDNLFISPHLIGKGLGRLLMNDFLTRVKKLGCTSVILYSDPNAEGFYEKFDFTAIGKKPTSIENRFLPVLHKRLD